MYRGHVFFDWDDTIAENIHLFHVAEERAAEYVAHLTGVPAAEVLQLATELDVAISHKLGLGRDSFPTAWVTCYEQICGRAGRSATDAERAEVWRLADWPYAQPQPLIDGAAETVRVLHQEGYELTVWTAGDPAVQARKIQDSGLSPYFHHRSVVTRKEAVGLRSVIGDRDLSRCVVVGNSASSDIRPALQVGVLALHIPAETWAYDVAQLDTADPSYLQLASIDQVPGVLKQRLSLAG